MSALDKQEGGNHYKNFQIQPVEFTMKNKLDFIQGNIIKYATRHKLKNGPEDLKKVIHYAELGMEFDYGIKPVKNEESETTEAPFMSSEVSLKTLALMFSECLLKFGEAKVEEALEQIVDDWKKSKTEIPDKDEKKEALAVEISPEVVCETDPKEANEAGPSCIVSGCTFPQRNDSYRCDHHYFLKKRKKVNK